MFSSVSKATPQTQRTTGFIASRAMTIVPVTPFTITVNGVTPPNPFSVSVNAGDTVTASVTTPDDWLWHEFYHYEIDGVPSSFAVVNKSNYTISVKPEDAIKRWYMYEPPTHTGTYKSVGGTNYSVNFGTNYETIPTDYHIVLNPLDNGVYFFDINGVQVSKINLPADPLDYVKIPDRQSVVVLVRGGEAYEVYLNNTTFGIAPFYARLNYSEFTDNTFVFQLPGEDLITYLRRARAKTAIPPATCLTYDGMFLFAGGNGSVWVVDPYADFNLVNEFEIDEFVMNITPLPNNSGVVFVTQSQKIYKMDYAGNFTELHQGTALWQPALFNGKVYIPEGEVGLLKVYNPATNSFEADILLDDFSPSHITVDSGMMYVAGHDSERVLIFDSALNITEKTFPDKVTMVSALNGTLVASHWMKPFKVLNLGDLRRIVAVEFLKRRGPVSHIGTSAVTVKTLGNDEVFARTPEGTWLWINGQRAYTEDVRGSLLVDGDIVSINRACRVAGLQRTNCIIGDVVYDYDTEAVAQTYFPRNIDLPIMPPGEYGVHTRTITLPRAFTPCLMSIEYGVVKVNGAYYYGDTNVTAGDIVSIEMETANNSILPVFTVGARQFVVPVSTNPIYTPLVYAQTNTNPSTPITEEITFGELETLFDYIIPGYYTATIKKNNVDITGNYFQQFGVGDKLTVNYITSPKLYDTTDIYILGPTNYKFTAQNTLGNPIDYLDYGDIIHPYTRLLDPYAINGLSFLVDNTTYGYAVEYTSPEIQYITGNITIAGVQSSTPGYRVLDFSLSTTYSLYQAIKSTPAAMPFATDANVTSDTPIIVFNQGNTITSTWGGTNYYLRSLTSNSKISLFNVNQLMFYVYQSGAQPPEEDLILEYSINGSSWALLYTVSYSGIPNDQWVQKMFTVPVGAKVQSGVYIRITHTAETGPTFPANNVDVWACTSFVATSLDRDVASISIAGGDSYFVLDGNIQSSDTIFVSNGNLLALARNITSYFDSNVTIVQHLPTGDDDGQADIVVGRWGLINREIIEIKTPEQRTTMSVNEGSIGTYDYIKNINVFDTKVEFSRVTQRTLHSSKEQLELEAQTSTTASSIKSDQIHLASTVSFREELNYPEPLSVAQSTHELFTPTTLKQTASVQDLDQLRITSVQSASEQREIKTIRNLNASLLVFDKHQVRTEPSYKEKFVQVSQSKQLAPQGEFFESLEISNVGYKITRQEQVSQTLDKNRIEWEDQASMFVGQNSIRRLGANFRLGLAYLNIRDIPKFLVFFDLSSRNNQDANPITSDPYKTMYHEDNIEIVSAPVGVRTEIEYLGNIAPTIGTINTNLGAILGNSSLTSLNNFSAINADASTVQSIGVPSFMANYVSVSKTDINNWIDRDTSWQTTNFFMTPAPASIAKVEEENYYFIDDIIADKVRFERLDWDHNSPRKIDYNDTNIVPAAPDTEIAGGAVGKIEPTRLEFDRSSYDLIDLIPDVADNQNYLEVDMIARIMHSVETMVGQVFIKIDINDTMAETLIDKYSLGLPVFVKSLGQKLVPGAGGVVKPVGEKLAVQSAPVKINYFSFQLAEREFEPFNWRKEEPINLTFDYTPADANPLNIILRFTPADANPLNNIPIKPIATPMTLNYPTAEMVYWKENTIRGTTAKANAVAGSLDTHIASGFAPETTTQAFDMYIKPDWAQEEYSIEPFVVYRLQHEQQKNIDPREKIVMERERPQFYFTAITIPEIDRGIVWDHDISTEYGAFATENDAYLAAASYSSFRPYQILDTNLWSYRVLFDTGLVCPLPSGRYAIAWLIRGG